MPIKNITENDISFKKELVILKIQEKLYKIPAREISCYYNEIFNVNNEENKIKIVHYFLTNASLDLNKIHLKSKSYYRQIAPILKMIKAEHDPLPDHTLHLFLYNSLQSVQWHLLSHGITDLWMNPHKPYLTYRIIPENKMKSVWSGFIDHVQCERWGIKDLPYKNSVWCKKKWQRRRNKLIERSGQLKHNARGCNNCINEQGAKKFITCCDFFEEYRIKYLEKLRKWIINTIQDNNLVYHYGKDRNMLPEGKVSSRKHIHATNVGTEDLMAYVIDQGDDEKNHVYLMIFQLVQSNLTDISRYRLKTVYGIASKNSYKEAETYINESIKHTGLTFNYFCHPTNWDAII